MIGCPCDTMGGPGVASTTPALIRTCLGGPDLSDATCSVAGCGRPSRSLHLCQMHYKRVRRLGTTQLPDRYRHLTVDGYVRMKAPDHPVSNSHGWALEHRVVAWERFGPFDLTLHVHHVNGDKQDNRPENLEILTPTEHAAEHARRKIDVEEAAVLYRAGHTTTQLASRYGTHSGNLSRALRAAGVEMREAGVSRRVTRPPEAIVRAAYAESRSAVDLANRLDVPTTVARSLMRELDLASFPNGRPATRRNAA